MRAKPDMKPWGHTDKSRMSSAGAALQREHLPYVSEVLPLRGLPDGSDKGYCSKKNSAHLVERGLIDGIMLKAQKGMKLSE